MPSNITLYSWATPNGIKASIALEELGLPYKLEPMNIATNIQKEEYANHRAYRESSRSYVILILSQMVFEDKPQWPNSRAP